MKLKEIMQGIEYKILQEGSADEASHIAIDSRKIESGGLFICMKGLSVDGHKFIDNAAKKDAAAIVIEAEQASYPKNLTVFKVADARKSLAHIAANFYGHPEDKLRLFGVTGTNGKTSVTYIMESILQEVAKPALIGTVGLRFDGKLVDIPFATSTTPDPPELMQIFDYIHKNNGRDVVMEVSSHALALHKMAGLNFEVAMFTNLTQDHLDFHGTMENYLAAKAKLFGQCRIAVVNKDDKYSPQIMSIGSPERWITYGIDSDCDLRAINIKEKDAGYTFTVANNDFYLPVKGRFNIYNALACIGAALVVGINAEQIKAGLANFKGVPGRIQSISNDKGFNVIVDYAHSPDGLINIINSVREFTTGRVITLFGCGGDRDVDKRPIMGRIAGELSDYCILTSDNPRSEPPEAILKQIEAGIKDCEFVSLVDRREAILYGISMLNPGDSLIIAGKGHENYQIFKDETIHFDDVEVAKEGLSK